MFSWFTQSTPPPTSPPSFEEWPKVRILVLGDSGVGKTCLLERLVNGKPSSSTPRWTLGCDVSIMVHTLAEQTERKILIEFWDVGGHRNYSDVRAVFYHQINGVMLVHDATNKKSFNHLKSWLEELEKEDSWRKSKGLVGVEEPRFGSKQRIDNSSSLEGGGSSGIYRTANPPMFHHSHHKKAAGTGGPLDGLPILVVGNKYDSGRNSVAPTFWNFDSVLTSALAPSRDGLLFDHEKFFAFFQKVYERRYG